MDTIDTVWSEMPADEAGMSSLSAHAVQINAPLDAFLASFLAGVPGGIVEDIPASEFDVGEVAQRACYHGIQGLLVESTRFSELAPEAHRELFRAAAADAVSELLHREILEEICTAFAHSHVDALYLKGTALAYLAYQKPSCRPRVDSDILVPEDQLAAATAALEALGFHAPPLHAPHYQRAFSLERSGFVFQVDLHWRAANSELVSRAYEHAFLSINAQPIARLQANAFAPADEVLLSFGISHLLYERDYRDGDRLIWLVDFRHLASRMDDDAWRRFIDFQRRIGAAGAAVRALAQAEKTLGRFVSAEVMAELAAAPAGDLTRYLAASEFGRMRREIACRSPREAVELLRKALFPPRERLVEIYGPVRGWQVPFLYLHRAAGGVFKAKGRSRQ